MGYNYTDASLQSTHHDMRQLALAGIIAFTHEFPGEFGGKVTVDVQGQKVIIIITGKQTRVYTWEELGFVKT